MGDVWRSTSLAEFCHLLALLLESRLPLPEALRLTGEGVQDSDVDASCRLMASQVDGRSLSGASHGRVRLFPAGLPRLVRWAENQRSLPEVLHMAGAMFESRARSYSTFVGTVLNVLCVLLVLAMVLFVPALFHAAHHFDLPVVGMRSTLSENAVATGPAEPASASDQTHWEADTQAAAPQPVPPTPEPEADSQVIDLDRVCTLAGARALAAAAHDVPGRRDGVSCSGWRCCSSRRPALIALLIVGSIRLSVCGGDGWA